MQWHRSFGLVIPVELSNRLSKNEMYMRDNVHQYVRSFRSDCFVSLSFRVFNMESPNNYESFNRSNSPEVV